MPVYLYKAKRSTSETVTGHIDAGSQDEAIDLISGLGLIPVSVVESQESGVKIPNARRKISGKELYLFNQQLAVLLRSNVSILAALEIVRRQIRNPYLSEISQSLLMGVRNGRSLSDCLAQYPDVFSPLYVTMVHIGENSANLQGMLAAVTQFQRRQEEFLSRIRMAMVYPCLMIFLGIASVYFILSFVLPKMSGLFQSIKTGLPLPTKIILAISAAVTKFWPVFLVLFFILLIMLRYAQTPKGRIIINRILFRIPVINDFLRKADLSRFARTLFLLLKSGMPMIAAIRIVNPMMRDDQLKKELTDALAKMTAGASLSDVLSGMSVMPSMVGYMISVGEESGNIEEVFQNVADFYEQEVDEKIKMMTTLIEPIMILLIGLVIGVIVFAILLPIFQIDAFSY